MQVCGGAFLRHVTQFKCVDPSAAALAAGALKGVLVIAFSFVAFCVDGVLFYLAAVLAMLCCWIDPVSTASTVTVLWYRIMATQGFLLGCFVWEAALGLFTTKIAAVAAVATAAAIVFVEALVKGEDMGEMKQVRVDGFLQDRMQKETQRFSWLAYFGWYGCCISILVARWVSFRTWLGMSVVWRFLRATWWWGTRFGAGQRPMLASSGGHGSLFMHGCWDGRRFNAGRVRSAGRTSAGLHECRASGAGVPGHVMVPDGRVAGRWAGSSLIRVGRLMGHMFR